MSGGALLAPPFELSAYISRDVKPLVGWRLQGHCEATYGGTAPMV